MHRMFSLRTGGSSAVRGSMADSVDEDDSLSYYAGGGAGGSSSASVDESGTVRSTAFSLPDDFVAESDSGNSPVGRNGAGRDHGEDDPYETDLRNAFTIRVKQQRHRKKGKRRSSTKCTFCLYTLLIIFCGAVASCAFLVLGITGADRDQFRRFEKQASEIAFSVRGRYQEFETSALWIHESCHVNVRHKEDFHGIAMCTQFDFLELYQYLRSGGLHILAAQFIPRVRHEERQQLEIDSLQYYRQYFPSIVDYGGITELQNPNDDAVVNSDNSTWRDREAIFRTEPRGVHDEYFPMHYVAPIAGNEEMIELDVRSSDIRSRALDTALDLRTPTLTSRMFCYDDHTHDPAHNHEHSYIIPGHYSLMLMHPGIPLQSAQQYAAEQNAYRDHLNDHRDHSHTRRRLTDSDTTTAGQHNIEPNDVYYGTLDSVSSVQISVMELLRASTIGVTEHLKIYLYEETDNNNSNNSNNNAPDLVFLGAADVAGLDYEDRHSHEDDDDNALDHDHNSPCSPPHDDEHPFHPMYVNNIPIRKARDYRRVHEESLELGNRTWRIVIAAAEGSYGANFLYYILGASFIMIACLCIALWFYTSMRRARIMNRIKAHSRAEKAAMIVQNSREAARAERELNDFLAHEVRNPLSAAIAASSFVSAEVNEVKPLVTEESKESVREDMHVIHSSLQFINDLLRNILDMHRASSQQMTIELAPTDVRADVLEPVATMLHKRDNAYQVELMCPDHLIIMTDRLRLKQIVMNLASNARKFIQKGFIRLRAEIDGNNTVVISVEDSGSGIPDEKRDQLFCKFQQSLDSLSQGTGIGLALCKHLSKLLGGELTLDNSYDSGVEGCPGARFVIDLNAEPIEDMEMDLNDSHDSNGVEAYPEDIDSGTDKAAKPATATVESGEERTHIADSSDSSGPTAEEKLPQHLRVLFVDDDFVLRKLFMRTIKRVAPGWDVSEASNGETALRLTETNEYDVIFLDQYMASVEKQLLGTETARAMRSKGVRSKICGLSANDIGEAFLKSGATSFMMKPFPCQKDQLTAELIRVIYRPDVRIDLAFADVSLVMNGEDEDDEESPTTA